MRGMGCINYGIQDSDSDSDRRMKDILYNYYVES